MRSEGGKMTNEESMNIAVIIAQAFDRAHFSGETTFFRIYKENDVVHFGELIGDAANEMESFYNTRREAKELESAKEK